MEALSARSPLVNALEGILLGILLTVLAILLGTYIGGGQAAVENLANYVL